MNSLKSAGAALVMLAFATGCVSMTLWLHSANEWSKYLMTATHRGETLYSHLVLDGTLPVGMTATALPTKSADLADAGDFERLPDLPYPALVTVLTVGAGAFDARSDVRLKLAAISPKLRYPLSELQTGEGGSSQQTLGAMTGLMAKYCSDAVLLIEAGQKGWQRIDGLDIWHCDAAPADRRLLAVLLGLVGLVSMISVPVTLSGRFADFAIALGNRNRNGRTKPLQLSGPSELRAIIKAVNGYRDMERQHLSERAVILSGVSHDLGTPATRLKLRAATIEDAGLRRKFEADIDQMTGIIESVLTYTRAELSTEEPRKLSLTSLVEAIVADYVDMGSPVSFTPQQSVIVEGGQSIFMSKRGQKEIEEDSPLVIPGRPLALRRAIGNLIDNALKYGRRATVRLEADADEVRILVEDEGGALPSSELEKLMRPFQRGANAQTTKGFGMGLTIVSSIALEHGGDLTFGPGQTGTIAQLRIPRR